MKLIKTIALLFPILLFSQSKKITSQEEYIDFKFPLSENVVIYRTGPIASKAVGYIYRTIQITAMEEINIDSIAYRFDKDEFLVNKYKVGKYLLYQSSKDPTIGIAKKVNSTKCFFYRVIKDDLTLGRQIKNVKINETKSMVSERKIYFHESLAYIGRTGTILKFKYYRYINQNDHADIEKELTFDLSKNNIFQCEKLKIKILNADASSIEFVKLSTF